MKHCFIGSLSSCLGKNIKEHDPYVPYPHSLQCMETWIPTNEILSLPPQKRTRGQCTAYVFQLSKNALDVPFEIGSRDTYCVCIQKYSQYSSCDYGVLKNYCPLKKAPQPDMTVK